MKKKKDQSKEIEKEKLLDQEEIIEFEYYDEINKKNVIIKDKRKIKVALLEMDLLEREQREDVGRNECSYNPQTDVPINENEVFDKVLDQEQVEELLEDVLQEVLSKTWQKSEDEKKIKSFLKDNFFKLSKNQAIALFMDYFLEFDKSKIAEYLTVSSQRAGQILARLEQILKENSQ